MKRYMVHELRNVSFFSHGGAGKTTLAEAMLYQAGATTRLGRVEEGTTVSDYDPDEIRRHISVQCSLLPFEWRGVKVNLLDPPGYADFVGEVRQALRVADAAVTVIDAVAGCEVGTELTWQHAEELGLPRLVFINKMDRENAEFSRTLDQTVARLGRKLVALQLPIGAQADFQGVIDLIARKAFFGPKGEEGAIPGQLETMAEEWRDKLVEAIVETDDELLSKYLDGQPITEESLQAALRRAVHSGAFVPVLCGAGLSGIGVQLLMAALVDLLPAPNERGPVAGRNPTTQREESWQPSEHEPLAVLAFKTTADPYVGRLSYLRVCSGVLHSDSHVWNANKGKEERIGQLFFVRGKAQEPVGEIYAGDSGAVAKLQETTTGDTLCGRDRPIVLPSIVFPNPSYGVAVEPKSKADLDKLGASLARLVDEDPTLQVHREISTGETILSGMGESHVEIAVERMKRKFGLEVTLATPRVPYRETILASAKAEYKHKKQTGGHGQYGHVFLELEPLPRGTGFEFAERIFGGAVPRNYIPAVEKGVREAIPEGVLAGYPVVDVKVTLFDGSYHPVDSSEMSFKIAGAHALRKGLETANPTILEPIMNLTVIVPDEYVGEVMSDLNGKRCRVQGMEPGGSLTTIHAQGPLAELQRYATDLRAITQGRGTYTAELSHYEEVPPHLHQTIIAEAKKRAEQKAKA
ncbi:MAG: elongation factor G [Chloroflexi bacterium]|nr:elongation factor G [Chloroflexota bacterium]